MVLPKGNPLLENMSLSFPDINVMMNNLEQQSFTGYIRFEMEEGTSAVIYFRHGVRTRAVEMSGSNLKVLPQPRVINRLKSRDVPLSTFIVSSQIVEVLESNFAFQPLYLDYEVKERELKKVMSTLLDDSYTGIIEFVTKEGNSYLLIDKGEIVTDFFAQYYGQIIAGTETVSNFLNLVSNEGAVINIYAEKQEEIDEKRAQADSEIEKIKQLIVKEEKGFFKAGDLFWIDEYILQEWGIRNLKSLNLELETPEGIIYIVKAQPNKRLGGYISTAVANMKKHKIKEGDLVSVRPV